MSKHDEEKKSDAREEMVSMPASAYTEMFNARVRDEVLKILTAKTPDEQIAERLDALRGKNRPPPLESLVECRSPITGSTFKARCVQSKTYPDGRIVEILDYTFPDGIDVPKDDGGLCDMPREKMFVQREDGEFTHDLTKPYLYWRYQNFWAKDWNELSGQPASFLAQWRVRTAA
jgi:hypothetical protein